MTKPNLFDFATSELSQDAFLCWLLSWADSKFSEVDPQLHRVGRDFIRSIGRKCGHGIFDNGQILEIKVMKQYKNIDILAIVSTGTTKYALTIEDKTYTTMHGEQLRSYRDTVEQDFAGHKPLFVYFKTGEISRAAVAESAGYSVYSRKDFLKVLGSSRNESKNSILGDFHEHLSALDYRFEAFRRKPVIEWVKDNWAWEGFLGHLQTRVKELEPELDPGWGYAPNPTGGEYVFYCGGGKFCHGNVYLEIHKKLGKEDMEGKEDEEYERSQRHFLAFKVSKVPESEDRGEVRWNLYTSIMATAKEFGWDKQIDKPKRFGHGQSMVFCETKVQDCWLATDKDGRIDIGGTIKRLVEANKLLCAAIDRYEESDRF